MVPEAIPNSTVLRGSSARWTEKKRYLGVIGLAVPSHGHFYIEHNRGHHVRVAIGPASSRLGQNLCQFRPRT